jgi:hypothetical protein
MTLSLFLNFKAVSRVCFLTLRLAATCLKRHTNNCGRVYAELMITAAFCATLVVKKQAFTCYLTAASVKPVGTQSPSSRTEIYSH